MVCTRSQKSNSDTSDDTCQQNDQVVATTTPIHVLRRKRKRGNDNDNDQPDYEQSDAGSDDTYQFSLGSQDSDSSSDSEADVRETGSDSDSVIEEVSESSGEIRMVKTPKRHKNGLRIVVPLPVDDAIVSRLRKRNDTGYNNIIYLDTQADSADSGDSGDSNEESADSGDSAGDDNESSGGGNANELGKDYIKFMKHVDNIYTGNFFQRTPPEEKMSRLKQSCTQEEIADINKKLEELQKEYRNNSPSIIDILRLNIHPSAKAKLLEKVYQFTNSDVLSHEYNAHLKQLMTSINKKYEPELEDLEKRIIKSSQSEEFCDDYKKKILMSNMPFNNKVIAYKRLEIMERYEESDSSEYAKYKNWVDSLLAVPFGKHIETPVDNTQRYIADVRSVLDKRLSFLENPKDQIINIVTQMLRNPDFKINAIGLYGVAGVGKSSIVKSIAEALGRPYRSISLGGESDASTLSGHNFTYVGSNPGRLIEILSETKCMNPIVLVDELDKVSQTHQGREIIGNLIHLTDSTTNSKYNYDRYFSGIEFDLSKVLFVFTYNDPDKVDPILADRLYKIKIDNYTFAQKLEIAKKHLICNILQEYRLSSDEIRFTEEAIDYVIRSSMSNTGMREIKRKFEIVVSRINTLVLTNPQDDIVKLKYKRLYPHYRQFPVEVPKEHIDIFLENSIATDTSNDAPMGMYI
jgi:ATP-dependent Lon protease